MLCVLIRIASFSKKGLVCKSIFLPYKVHLFFRRVWRAVERPHSHKNVPLIRTHTHTHICVCVCVCVCVLGLVEFNWHIAFSGQTHQTTNWWILFLINSKKVGLAFHSTCLFKNCVSYRMDNGQDDFHDVSIDNQTFDENIHGVPQAGRSRIRPRMQSDGNISTTVHQRLTTVDGTEFSSAGYAGFIEIQRETAPVDGAYFMNVLPAPALDIYSNTPPPSFKVGRRVKHPNFHDFGRRNESFRRHNWPLVEPSAQKLAKADMFYSGTFI